MDRGTMCISITVVLAESILHTLMLFDNKVHTHTAERGVDFWYAVAKPGQGGHQQLKLHLENLASSRLLGLFNVKSNYLTRQFDPGSRYEIGELLQLVLGLCYLDELLFGKNGVLGRAFGKRGVAGVCELTCLQEGFLLQAGRNYFTSLQSINVHHLGKNMLKEQPVEGFDLQHLYSHLFGPSDIRAHTAWNDTTCIMLLEMIRVLATYEPAHN